VPRVAQCEHVIPDVHQVAHRGERDGSHDPAGRQCGQARHDVAEVIGAEFVKYRPDRQPQHHSRQESGTPAGRQLRPARDVRVYAR
jgi:hypothetical protein